MNSLTETLKQLSADGTGVNLEILKGQHNFNRWARDFQAVAQAKGVWDAINGSLTPVEPPDWDQYTSGDAKTDTEEDSSSKRGKRKSRATLGPDEITKLQETTTQDGKSKSTLDLNTRLAFYKFDLDSYEKYEKKTSQALALLVTWVDPIIRGKLQSHTTAYHAFEYLKQQYKMSDVRAQELANNDFESVHMSTCNSVQEYLNKLENARLDITDVGGHCDDAMMSSKIIRGLTEPFYPFVDQYHFLRDLETNAFNLSKLTTRLLTYESDLRQRTKPKNVMAIQGNFGRRNSNLKCGTCNKIGHTNERCWITHPELKKSPEEFRSWKKSQDPRKGSHVRVPERAVAMTQLEQPDRKLGTTKRFAAMTKANLNELHSRIEACESLDAVTDSNADPHAQANVDRQKMKQLAKGDCQGRHDGGSSNGRRSDFSAQSLGVRNHCSSSPFPDKHVTSPDTVSINAMMLTQNGNLSVEHDDWILDGGANTHVVNDKRWFTEFYDFNLQVATADDGSVLEIQGGGTVELCLDNTDGNNVILELSKVAYAPNVRCNILSQSALGQFGDLRGLWNKRGITIETQHGESVAEATERDGMYYLKVRKLTSTRCEYDATTLLQESSCPVMPTGSKPPLVVATIDFNDPVWKWHRRLGHLSFENMRRLSRVSRGMNITEKQIKAKLNAICPVCATSRAINRIPREPATRRFEGVGDMLHADTWGPYGLPGFDGTKFFLAITDDAMRYTWADPFQSKSEIGPLFRKMLARIETVHNTKIRVIRGDNEMFENDTRKWCEQKGIQLEPTVPYAHHQNGVAERNFRTEREKTAAMLQEHTLPKRTARIIEGLRDDMLRNCTAPERLWPEAWKHAVWLKNRTPTRALKSRKTPFELIKGHPPDLRRERIWGSRAYVTVPPEQRGPKLHQPRGWLGYFMGCESESVYRIWNPERNKVMRISTARVEDGEGMDDQQDEPSRQNRILDPEFSPLDNLGEEQQESDSGESEYDPVGEDLQQEEQNEDRSEVGDDNRSTVSIDNGEANDQDQTDEQPVAPGDRLDVSHNNSDAPIQNNEDSTSENSEDDSNSKNPKVSPYFTNPRANMVKRKRGSNDETDQTPQPKARGQPKDQKCKSCAKSNSRCNGTYPFHTKCSVCNNERRACEPQDAPDKPKPQRATSPGVETTEKCKQCFRSKRRCNGEEPCSSCLQRKRTCEPQGAPIRNLSRQLAQPLKIRCRQCRNNKDRKLCDLQHPCSNCKISGKNCDYGTEPLRYEIDHTQERCGGCKAHACACIGGKPCNRCKKKGISCVWKNGDSKRTFICESRREYWEKYAQDPETCIDCQQWCPTVVGGPPCNGELPCSNCVDRSQSATFGAKRQYKNGKRENCLSYHRRCRYARPDDSIERIGLIKPEKLQERLRSYQKRQKLRNTEDKEDSENDLTDEDLLGQLINSTDEDEDKDEDESGDEDEGGSNKNSSDEDDDDGDTQDGNADGKTRDTNHGQNEHDDDIGQGPSNNLEDNFDASDWGDAAGYRRGDSYPPADVDYHLDPNTDQGGIYSSDLHSTNVQSVQSIQLSNKDADLSGGVGNLSLLDDKNQSFFSTATADENRYLDESTEDVTDIPLLNRNVYSIQNAPQRFVDLADSHDANHGRFVKDFAKTKCAVCIAEMALDPEPHTRRQALQRPDAARWQIAMQDEYDSLIKNETWTIVDRPATQHVLSTRWVLRRKLGADGQILKYKARHVVRGFEQIHGIDFDETFASVVKQPSYRLLFALQAQFGWLCHQMDVKTAFLHGEVDEDIFTEPPDGFPEKAGKVLKLNKALYGLKQAPRQWYKCLTRALIRLGWKVLESDSSVFKHPKGLFLTIWVDDLNIFGPEEKDIIKAKEKLAEEFDMTDLGECAYYLGMHVQMTPDATYLHQAGYIQQMLNRFHLNEVPLSRTPTSPHKKIFANTGETASRDFIKDYQAKVGSVNYSATITRPDISFAVSRLARYMSNPSDEHMREMHVLFGYLKSTMFLAIKYSRGDAQISRGLVDSDYGGCLDTYRSTTGWVFLMAGAPVSWSSKRQKTVAMSSCEAEYVAASEATKEAMWLRRLLKELIGVYTLSGLESSYTSVLEIDNNSAMKLSKNPEFHARSKHIAIRHHFIREQIASGTIALRRIDTRNNLADILTKGLPRPRFEELVQKLGMSECSKRPVILDRGSIDLDANG